MSRAESVHPRLRGELLNGAPLSQDQGGSSPLTRGTQKTAAEGCRNKRFIPAYAGNSLCHVTPSDFSTVHPRLRGELLVSFVLQFLIRGSSPLTRGTRINHLIFQEKQPVHPRLRGELGGKFLPAPSSGGSSPLTRGTLL